MRLIQNPFSHNSIKVRRALELKDLAYETHDIAPTNRAPVVAVSGQPLVPVLQHEELVIPESTAILRFLEETYPEPSLLPEDPAQHASCWMIEDWADGAFMSRTRRLAYWQVLTTPGMLEQLFFPDGRGLKRALMTRLARRVVTKRFGLSAERNEHDNQAVARVARIALDRLAGRPGFFGDRITVADITLATLVAPLLAVRGSLRDEPAVRDLLDWSQPILGESVVELYSATLQSGSGGSSGT